MKNWYLVKTKPRQENVAIKNLENQEYTTYCPIVTINNKQVVLFPGYIFIHLDKKTENWSPIRSTKGVVNFVRFGLYFAQVPDNVIEFIKANQLIVQITDGVFKNCVAIFKSFKSDERVILLMNILGQQQAINIKQESLIGL